MGFKYLLSTLTVLVTLSSPAISQSWSSWNSVVQDNLVQDTIWNALRNEVGSNNLGTETSFYFSNKSDRFQEIEAIALLPNHK